VGAFREGFFGIAEEAFTEGSYPVGFGNQANRVGAFREGFFAGHPSPFLIRNGIAEEAFTEGSYPVGLVPEAEYTAACLKLEPGDTLVLFSDGVTEAMDPEDEMFGMTRLAEVLQDKSDVPLEHLQKCVLESVENFVRGARQAD